QVPGFQLDDGDTNTRGFANAAGNLLINDRRPSAKQDLPSAILLRIPSGNVERIELIRGQVRDIDLRGQSAMINVITHEENPASLRWGADVEVPVRHGPVTPSVYLSLSNTWNEIEYNAGLEIFKNSYGRDGMDQLFDGVGTLTENRIDNRENRNVTYKGNLSTLTWLGETLFKFNGIYSFETRDQELVSNRIPLAIGSPPRDVIFVDDVESPEIEIGVDAERNITPDLLGKAILLFFNSDTESLKTQEVIDDSGNQTSFRVADSTADSLELITRLEFNWTRFEDHTVKANMERAYNRLEGTLLQTLDTGTGPDIVDVPGANSTVKEERYDFILQDIWSLAAYELDIGLGAEVSSITQTGDAEQTRDFFYLKPHAMLTYAPEQSEQTRFRVAREVAQLDLTEFVSATVFEDDDLALGNPDLEPETTWVTELSHERRFGQLSVLSLRLFHHWIADVQDLLPLTTNFEVPGNIGSGRRWGFEIESTLPMDRVGLDGSRL
ncbi:MAG: TonB-dependent receptor, partial [Gammaproteobacteria bacterium]|nr:TonB-dependent receptor [Gammaproteobacteria bacterium]